MFGMLKTIATAQRAFILPAQKPAFNNEAKNWYFRHRTVI